MSGSGLYAGNFGPVRSVSQRGWVVAETVLPGATISEGAALAFGWTGGLDWADIALTCGYFDQPHFLHDFQTFSGINPSSYLADHIDACLTKSSNRATLGTTT
jgi:hypothetical protein